MTTRKTAPAKGEQKVWALEFSDRVAANLRAYREKLGISAEKLSRLTSDTGYTIPRSSLANLESGAKKSITAHELAVLAQTFGIPEQALIWDIFEPAKEFSFSPNSPKVPGYLVFSELNISQLRFSSNALLTTQLSFVQSLAEIRNQIMESAYHARVTYPNLANKAYALDQEALARDFERQCRIGELEHISLSAGVEIRAKMAEQQQIKIWDMWKQDIYISTFPFAVFQIVYDFENDSDSELPTDFKAPLGMPKKDMLTSLGIETGNHKKVIRNEDFPKSPYYQITEEDRARFSPKVFWEF
ncbi:helix-turn-helix transcriptional regulator [Rothia sp. ZJ932]|uniref:helix-turn-helix domain-containing protein n=1 Tax=Rothia sp. ZJ932 TaxID=2810516 RepID=UPI001967FFC2|nr:helix-turn-helix transcriptional regulator [Rothia sp. ZJ932]QRZ61131.1 helix-turn-helix transcriptional regulator [Rothia sp. ZJ932]